MSYDDEMRRKISIKLAGSTRLAPSEWRRDVDAVCDALDPLTLKTENGRFVRVIAETRLPYPEGTTSHTLYRIEEM